MCIELNGNQKKEVTGRLYWYQNDIGYSWWCHQWKRFPRYRPFVQGIHLWPVNSPYKASDAEIWCFLCLNKRLSKQSRGWWFETPSRPLWRHCNVENCVLLFKTSRKFCDGISFLSDFRIREVSMYGILCKKIRKNDFIQYKFCYLYAALLSNLWLQRTHKLSCFSNILKIYLSWKVLLTHN